MAFIAAIRRVPGGSFVKAPKSQNFTAVPVQTTLSNLYTYFDAWPKRAPSSSSMGPVAPTALHRVIRPRATYTSRSRQVHLGQGLAEVMEPMVQSTFTVPTSARRNLPPATASLPGASVDLVLVGDSLGNCRLGLPDTVGVTMDDMLRALHAVRRGVDALAPAAYNGGGGDGGGLGPKPAVVGDMPFGSYLVEADALKNAAAFRMAGAELVKLEGGRGVAPLVRALTNAGIPVMGHIGLLPQSAELQGGLRMQGTTARSAMELITDAKALADAGAVLLVVECVPSEVGAAVQAAVPDVPVIGIGAGGDVAGQVLVCDDFLGLHGKPPSFVKMYANLAKTSANAYEAYVEDVRSGAFPGDTHMRRMKAAELDLFREMLPPNVAQTLPSPVLPVPTTPASPTAPKMAAPSTAPTGGCRNGLPNAKVPFIEFVAGRFMPLPKSSVTQARAISRLSSGGRVEKGSSRGVSTEASEVLVLRSRSDVLAWRRSLAKSVALVPTMGNLHEGHLELVDEAKRHAEEVIVSIFVNPAQFAAHEDLDVYPRTLERDLQLLQGRGVRAVFAPGPDEMYPTGSPGGTVVVPTFVRGKSEDACRPHFFTGVATVCLKLFNLCQPDVVIFGQKDAMQCAVIARMLQDLLLDSRISMVIAPTSRESDGLARSSRNSYLTPAMRRRAPAIYKALSTATADASTGTAGCVRKEVTAKLEAEGMEVSYVSVADPCEMEEKEDDAAIANSVVSIACLLSEGDQQCRLIDNVVVPAV
eukprot:CAMPEP_0115392196 /NCGR_PEP_ID=MMETSP0271-20121206/11097_1 /TAXON_ID=71861 /ORGANISM="Scrippsiella trochoidea, Strain CCMP3099" /LENGTH=756 /DNA_ID=CAMNT_0002815771 /DNA_START=23 /DNA_END=2294 /DNA_ORIENTATION=+